MSSPFLIQFHYHYVSIIPWSTVNIISLWNFQFNCGNSVWVPYRNRELGLKRCLCHRRKYTADERVEGILSMKQTEVALCSVFISIHHIHYISSYVHKMLTKATLYLGATANKLTCNALMWLLNNIRLLLHRVGYREDICLSTFRLFHSPWWFYYCSYCCILAIVWHTNRSGEFLSYCIKYWQCFQCDSIYFMNFLPDLKWVLKDSSVSRSVGTEDLCWWIRPIIEMKDMLYALVTKEKSSACPVWYLWPWHF